MSLTHEPWPSFEENEIIAAKEVLESGKVNYWTGTEGREFENEFAKFVGTKYAVAVSNGTVAIEILLKSMNIGPGDEVIVTARSFLASASTIALVGAVPVFADVDRNSGNITPETIQNCLSSRTKAIICVHLAGWPCDMPEIMKIVEHNNIKVIEDCAQSHGATIDGKVTGSFGHGAAFSFCQDKIMTTGGEGGMICTNDKQIWKSCWSAKDHGKSMEKIASDPKDGGFNWVHDSLGTNARLTEFQSTIGRIQLKKLPYWLEQREHNAAFLRDCLGNFSAVRCPVTPPSMKHSNYKLYAYVDEFEHVEDRAKNELVTSLCESGVPCFYGSCSEMYFEKCFSADKKPRSSLSVAKELGKTSIMFLVHPTLSEKTLTRWAEGIDKTLTKTFGQ